MTTATADLPDLDGFETHYGMKVSSIGEDGDLVVLGHQEPFHAIAAMNAYSRTFIGLLDMLDGGGAVRDVFYGGEDGTSRLKALWMVDCVPFGSCADHVARSDENGCWACDQVREYAEYKRGWWLMEAAEDTPGAFPATLWAA